MKKIAIFLTTFAVVLASCSDFLDVNKDPNNAPTNTPALALPAGIASAGASLVTNYNIMGGMWVQYWAQNNGSNQYKNLDAYIVQQSTLNTDFNEVYSGSLQDLQFARNESKKQGDWNLYLMSTVMQSYVYQMMADIYDEIPFDEALQGNLVQHPHFRPGQEVYDSLIVRIDEALSKDFDVSTNTDPGTQDLLFNGDVDRWIQFANTLKLKIYLRQIYARPALAQSGIEALYTGSANFLTTSAAMSQFDNVENKSNPLFEADRRKLNSKENIKASRTFMEYLEANDDTLRRKALFTKPKNGYRGIEQGNFGESTVSIVPDDISTAIINATDTLYFMSLPEILFIRAEVAARGMGPGTAAAQGLYEAGIRAAFDRMNLPDTLAPKYYEDDGPYAYPNGAEEENLRAIAMQKWVALAGIEGLEAFFERNRLGYPEYTTETYGETYTPGNLVYPIGGVTGKGNYPKRLLFPETEQNRNPNTPAQVPATTKIWWDQK
ncbi:SusD/RagB family nutrient-binding outer membrane lipoprotein [Fulvivirgaceae bacterium PWU5]|uniref:SusD/RagB family nutrient-binding outer membrane lipoprotein n=1 Tax=Dawidia cretensis TaxID=2782350 RepID=A0AAP2GWP6_9BACT|nr:SusD/RagB family nutrient-binding outer membrane lipoprotein [Dawidia cretensis]MBT1711072.1 SusD/RagB family nutrient-binding outer membrane lipoprotein [Dawidia cretensis]